MVKRLRHRPFTAVTRVRFSMGSPDQSPAAVGLLLYIRGYGGIGRRAGFRVLWITPCRFDFCYPHQKKGCRIKRWPSHIKSSCSFPLKYSKSSLIYYLNSPQNYKKHCLGGFFVGVIIMYFSIIPPQVPNLRLRGEKIFKKCRFVRIFRGCFNYFSPPNRN